MKDWVRGPGTRPVSTLASSWEANLKSVLIRREKQEVYSILEKKVRLWFTPGGGQGPVLIRNGSGLSRMIVGAAELWEPLHKWLWKGRTLQGEQ